MLKILQILRVPECALLLYIWISEALLAGVCVAKVARASVWQNAYALTAAAALSGRSFIRYRDINRGGRRRHVL